MAEGSGDHTEEAKSNGISLFHIKSCHFRTTRYTKEVSFIRFDKGFSIASERAQKALACADRVLAWISDPVNLKDALDFAIKMVPLVQQIISLSTVRDPHSQRAYVGTVLQTLFL